MSEFELTVLRRRLLDAAVAKARRGELRMPVPVGYVWSRETGLALDGDDRQEARRFDRAGRDRREVRTGVGVPSVVVNAGWG